MEDHRVKWLRSQAVGFRKLNAGGNRCGKPFCQLAVERIVWPQDQTANRGDRRQLRQCVLFLIGNT